MTNRLRKLLLPLLKAVKEGRPISFRMRSAASQALFLAGKGIKKPSQGRLRRVSKRSTKKEETAQIYAIVKTRANGWCECGCMRVLELWGQEMDHFDGGTGKSQRQSVKSCWMLTRRCHVARQNNSPSAAFWNERFAIHAAKHGYPAVAHIEHQELPRRAQ